MKKLQTAIRKAILQVLNEDNNVPPGVVDGHNKPIRTGKMARPIDKSDKRWGQVAGITIDLKVIIKWSDPESKSAGKIKSAEDPKSIEIY